MQALQAKSKHRADFLRNKDLREAFRAIDQDGSGKIKGDEFQELMTAIGVESLDLGDLQQQNTKRRRSKGKKRRRKQGRGQGRKRQGRKMRFRDFKQLIQMYSLKYPNMNVAGNLARYMREQKGEEEEEPVRGEDLQMAFDRLGGAEGGAVTRGALTGMMQNMGCHQGWEEGDPDEEMDFDAFSEAVRSQDRSLSILDIGESLVDWVQNFFKPPAPEDDEDDDDDDDNEDPTAPAEENGAIESQGGTKKALLVGINYIGSSAELGGCINDVKNQREMLTSHFGYDADNIIMLTEEEGESPTVANMKAAIEAFVADAAPGDELLFHYSGHGTQLPAYNAAGETDGKNECLVPLDYADDFRNNMIQDNYLYEQFYQNVPDGVTLICVYDCCHSGTMADLSVTRDLIFMPDLEADPQEATQARWLAPTEEVQAELDAIDPGQPRDLFDPDDDGDEDPDPRDLTNKNVISISGCQDNQTSADATINGIRQGAMSWSLFGTLEDNDYNVTYGQLLSGMKRKLRGRYTQVPGMASTTEEVFTTKYLFGPN